ncbi:breast cancer type 1 susceptibility protein isoform X2 [Anolis carolinensis]|uniref:breast cancer type 1 susceptibility protein isoform X2 n=1 Tax=Anolis carolinensis TaxID=28377 RepID=UPI00046277DB|nr:PREDICTED: breast cancer type 1 susceptibility protein isoform X2 [Anolis carolinensis]|eukprot:XP_008111383.1 PREDICTED: breast cancer type 1 susceptibility protein isoform X2 [Anolis carolinensis]
MDSSIPTITEVRGMLLALQKNLECPICLDVMKEPVSTNCAHIFCRFCTLKLLRQKTGVTQCPLCNAKVTKRSLREDVRFKQVIKVVLDVIRAFERDTGLKFSDDQCFPKKDTEATSVADSWKEQLVVDTKGYRGRSKRVQEREEGNTILGESSNLPVCNETNKRYSLRRKSRSNNAVVLEVGSDSSEDTYKKTTTVKCVDFIEEPLTYMGEQCAENQNHCPMNLPGTSAEHEALTILGECSFSEERLESIECTPAVTENVKVAAENLAKLKSQGLSSPDPSMGQRDTKPETCSLQQDGSCSSLSIPQAVAEATNPTADKQEGDGTEWADIMMPDGSSQMVPVNEEQQLQTQVSVNSPLNPVTGKRLMRSIQKVSEWLSKSKEVIPPGSFKDIHSEQVNQDLTPCTLDANFCVSQKAGQVENQGEVTMWHEGDLPVAKPVASKLEDKIFGRTYKRERKSTPLRNDKDTIHIQAEESIAVNTNACETPRRKTLARKRKATSELTPDDFIRRQDVKECRKRPVGVDCGSWEECDQTFANVVGSPVAYPKDAEFPEEPSIKKTVGSEQAVSICHKLSESNLKKKPNSSSKKSRQLTRPHGQLQFVVGGNPWSPEQSKIQIEDREMKERDTGQRQIRRSRRLQLLTEETWNGNKELPLQPEGLWKESEPANRENHKEDEREKKPMSSQAGNMPSQSVIENDPSILQKGLPLSETSLMDMKDDANKVCPSSLVSPCTTEVVKGLSVEEIKEGHSPYFIAPTVRSQGICSLLQSHPTAVKQSTSDKNKGIVAGQFDKSALCVQTEEGSGSWTAVVTESHSLPDDKTAGPMELNPETDDSEPDADFVQKIFSCSKRRSFLLHPGPAKESAAEIQRKLKVGKVEDGRVDCLEKLTQNEGRNKAVACVADKDITVQRLATSSSSFHELESTTEHLQLALKAPLPEMPSTPVQTLAKIGEGGNQLQSQKLTTERRASPGIGENTSGSSRSLSGNGRSPSILRNCNIQGSSLSLVNETCSNRDHFQKAESTGAEHNGLTLSTQPESIQPCPAICQPSLPQSSHVETKRSSIEQKQLNNDIEEAMDISSIGVPQCLVSKENLEQCTEEGHCVFELSSETPEGLLDPAIKSKEGPSDLLETDREDISGVSSKMDRPSLVGKDLGNNDSGNSMLKRKHFVLAHRKPVRKLPSSEEDESSEEEELPSFQARLFGTSSQALKNNETSVEMLGLQNSSRSHLSSKAEDVSLSQESECSVNLFSSQSHASEDSCSKACDTRHLTPVSGSVEKPPIPSKNKEDIQPSGDASRKDVQPKDEQPRYENSESNLGEECMGYDSEASHLGDSSGLSSQSEILTTQQRDAMQNDLKKLQHEMVIIEAALKQGTQHDAPEEWLELDKEDDFIGEQMRSPKGSTMKLTSGIKQSFLGDSFSPVKSTHGTLGSHYIPSSNPEELFSCDVTTKTNRSPATKPGTFRRPLTPRHEAQRSPTIARYCSKTKNPLLNSKKNMSLVASGLNQGELRLVQQFVRKTKSSWSNKMTEETTHVIMKTDEDRVCERTLKYFLGIAAQKWVVSYQWIEQSLQAERLLNEEDFEVRGDVINGRNHQGPKRSRESPPGKLFQGLEICCYGPFTDMLPEQLEWMVELCGASLVKQPHLFAHPTNSSAVIVVQPDVWGEDTACQGLPPQCNATVVLREWVLDSVASYQRQPFDGYTIH